jgi:hypothetical protein
VHVLFLGLTSMLLLQVVTVVMPELPFSQPPQKLSKNGAMTFWMLVMGFIGVAQGPLFAAFVYPSLIRTAIAAGVLVLASLGLDRLTRVRIGEEAERLEFEA